MTNSHSIYILESDSWIANNQQLRKVGSTINIYARIKTLQTSVPKPIKFVGLFTIENYNCYKLDNLIKIQLNNIRAKLGGGTEFYYDMTKDKLIELFNLFEIKYSFTDQLNMELIDDVTDSQEEQDHKHEKAIKKYEIKEFYDFDKINILLSPVGQNDIYYQNYLDTVVNCMNVLQDRGKYGIKSKDEELIMWSTQSTENNKRMNVGDIMIFTVTNKTEGEHIQVTRVTEVITKNTKELSQILWNDDKYEIIFILDKIKKITNITVANFCKKYCGYSIKKQLMGNTIMAKDKQKEYMPELLELLW